MLRAFLAASLLVAALSPAKADDIGTFDQPMKFVMVSTGGNCEYCAWLSATGVIESDTPAKFKEFLTGYPYKPTVYFNSPGGNLIAALELGRLIRAADMDTDVASTKWTGYGNEYSSEPGVCASACAYAFFGGVNRSVWDGSQLGFHQFYRDATTAVASDDDTLKKLGISADQFVGGLLVAYIVEMGVDARILTVASSTSSNESASLSDDELKAFNITTRFGFGDWWMEPFGQGLVAAARALDTVTQERQITVYCRAEDLAPIIMVSLDRYPNYELSPDDFRAAIFDAFIDVDESKVAIPVSSIEFSTTRDFFVVRVPLSDESARLIVNGKSVGVEISMPHALFNYGVQAGAALSPEAQKMIQLAFRNCV